MTNVPGNEAPYIDPADLLTVAVREGVSLDDIKSILEQRGGVPRETLDEFETLLEREIQAHTGEPTGVDAETYLRSWFNNPPVTMSAEQQQAIVNDLAPEEVTQATVEAEEDFVPVEESLPFANPPARPSSTDGEVRSVQNQEYVRFLTEMFARDRDVTRAIDETIQELDLLNASVTNVTVEVLARTIAEKVPDTGLTILNTVDFYRSGNFERHPDDPERDPEGYFTAIEEENGSAFVRGEEEVEASQAAFTFTTPSILAGIDETDQAGFLTDLNRTLSQVPITDIETRQAVIAQTMEQYRLQQQENLARNILVTEGFFTDVGQIEDARTLFAFERAQAIGRRFTERAGEAGAFRNIEEMLNDVPEDIGVDLFDSVLRLQRSAIIEQTAQQVADAVRDAVRGPSLQDAGVNLLDAQQWYFDMPESEFRQLQLDLYRAGIYGADRDPETIPWGDKHGDRDAFFAWNQAIGESATALQQGQRFSVEDVIDNMIARGPFADTLESLENTPTFEEVFRDVAAIMGPAVVNDSAQLANMADDAAMAVWGKRATGELRARMVSMIQATQQQQHVSEIRRQAEAEFDRINREAQQEQQAERDLVAEAERAADVAGTERREEEAVGRLTEAIDPIREAFGAGERTPDDSAQRAENQRFQQQRPGGAVTAAAAPVDLGTADSNFPEENPNAIPSRIEVGTVENISPADRIERTLLQEDPTAAKEWALLNTLQSFRSMLGPVVR